MQLNSLQNYPIVWINEDFQDENTYYPQAKIYKSETGEVIATINLEQDDVDNKKYWANWNVPVDSSRRGTYIHIKVIVYSNEERTTHADLIRDSIEHHVIQERLNRFNIPVGTGSKIFKKGYEIDYKLIQKIVREEIEKECDEKFKKLEKMKNEFISVLEKMEYNIDPVIKIPPAQNKTIKQMIDISKIEEDNKKLTKFLIEEREESINKIEEMIKNIKPVVMTKKFVEVDNDFEKEKVNEKEKKIRRILKRI